MNSRKLNEGKTTHENATLIIKIKASVFHRSKMADKDQIISQFSNVTGVDAGRAQFHLESAAWNLEVYA